MKRLNRKSRYSIYTKIIFFVQRRLYGQVLEPSYYWGMSPKVFRSFISMFRSLNRKNSPLSPTLRNLVFIKVSQINGCSFCFDLNTYLFMKIGSIEKIQALSSFEMSYLFNEKEKIALRYAIAMTENQVTEDLFGQLKKYFSKEEIIELTALIGFQNLSNKFNTALGIESMNLCTLENHAPQKEN